MVNEAAAAHERKVQAGELEKVKASEDVQVRNHQAIIEFTNATRKMVLELSQIVDAVQNNLINLHNLLEQQRQQLAILQQQFYQKGTTSYSEGD